MKLVAFWIITFALSTHMAFAQTCTWCGMADAPESLSWSTQIAPAAEPGERLIVTGTVFEKDGRAPAADVRIYIYHTNSEGVYPKRGDERGNGSRHGYLRGWMQTDRHGGAISV